MLKEDKLTIKLDGRIKYISYILQDYSYTLSLFRYNKYIDLGNDFQIKEMMSIVVELVDNENNNNEMFNHNNYSTIPQEHISVIKELVDLFNSLYVIPILLSDNIGDGYLNLYDYL